MDQKCDKCGKEFRRYGSYQDDVKRRICDDCTQDALAILKDRGIEIRVGGCGCCDGNYATVKIDGEIVIDRICNFHVETGDKEIV